ncbi:anion permease [Burkholderia multivorans]|nr:anion permease [Burkholderia multivorans]
MIRGYPVHTSQAAVLVFFTLASWALDLFREPLTTLLFFLFAVLFSIAPAATVFAGFTSPAWWLVFGGTITGIAIRTTGLAKHVADLLLAGPWMRTYRRCLTLVAVASVMLAFVMPSTTGRVLLLTPIVLTLAGRMGFAPGSPGHTGLVMTVAAASYMPPTAILPANIPNSVLLGAAQNLYGIHIHYGAYFLLHFPVLGLLKTIAIVLVIGWLYPDEVVTRPIRQTMPCRSLTGQEVRLAAVLLASVAGYATDTWHGISPAWISLAAGVACVLPHTRIVPVDRITKDMHIGPLLYVAGFLGLGAVIAETGLGSWAAQWITHWLPMTAGEPAVNALKLLVAGGGIGLLATLPGLPAVLTPLAMQWSQASSLSLYTVLMLQVPVFSTVLFPWQSPPMMIAMQLGSVSVREGTRACLVLAAVTIVLLFPLDAAWWHLMRAVH